MLKDLLKISLLSFLLVFTACQKDGSSSSESSIFTSDDTDKAVQLVDEANAELKKVKQIYIDNQGKIQDLGEAIDAMEIEKVKSIADDMVFQINNGLNFGGSAVKKIQEAKDLNISPAFRQYLTMKADALRQQLEAFELRRQAAQVLRDGFGGKDPQAITLAISTLKEKETDFKKLMEEGRALSQQANEYAEVKDREKKSQSKKQ